MSDSNDSNDSSARGLVKSLSIILSSQSISIALSIIKMKGVALILGPSGIGLLSIFTSLQSLVRNTSGLGMKMSGVREIAAVSSSSPQKLSATRKVLFISLSTQGLIACLLLFGFQVPIARFLFEDAALSGDIGLIGVSVFFGAIGSSQLALLQGMRRVKDLAGVTVFGSFVSTIAGLACVYYFETSGLVWFFISQAVLVSIVGHFYTRKLPSSEAGLVSFRQFLEIWVPLVRLGMAFMVAGLSSIATLFFLRSFILIELGVEAAGYFAAAMGLTTTYLGPVLAAMSADYYPRLTEVIKDNKKAHELMNIQTQIGLAIGGPMSLAAISCAPWLILLFYSAEFEPAIPLLQWQSYGNIFKMATWALVFSHVAAGRSTTYLFLDVSFNLILILMLLPSIASGGIAVIGPAVVVANIVSFLLNVVAAKRYSNFNLNSLSIKVLSTQVVVGGFFLFISIGTGGGFLIAIFGVLTSLIVGLQGARVVLKEIGPRGRIPLLMFDLFKVLKWPVNISS